MYMYCIGTNDERSTTIRNQISICYSGDVVLSKIVKTLLNSSSSYFVFVVSLSWPFICLLFLLYWLANTQLQIWFLSYMMAENARTTTTARKRINWVLCLFMVGRLESPLEEYWNLNASFSFLTYSSPSFSLFSSLVFFFWHTLSSVEYLLLLFISYRLCNVQNMAKCQQSLRIKNYTEQHLLSI